MLVLGIDPGLDGGMAVVDTTIPLIIDATLMPKIKRGVRSELNPYHVARFINKHAAAIEFAIFEDVSAMPNQGVTSMFTFGKVTGTIMGALGCYDIPIIYVKPAIWKLAFGLSSDKSLSFKKANQIFPNNVDLWPLKKHEGIVEASLIAMYGKRFI